MFQEHIRQSKESKLDELGRHSTKWTEKHHIQMRDLECMSVKYPPPPLSPITRKDVINGNEVGGGGDGHMMVASATSMDPRYGFHDHLMQPIKMPLPHAELSAQTSVMQNDYEVN